MSGADDASNLFTLRDRRIIRECVNEHSSDLPAAATQRPELPSGAERQIRRGGILSTEIQNAAQALPLACEDQLPKLPSDLERVVYSGRVLLIDFRLKGLFPRPVKVKRVNEHKLCQFRDGFIQNGRDKSACLLIYPFIDFISNGGLGYIRSLSTAA